MKWWVFQILVGWVISAPLWLTAAEPLGSENQGNTLKPDSVSHWVGMSGCSLKGCHNSTAQGGRTQFSLWARDDHARAFAVLRDAPSQQIAQAAGLSTPAHQSLLCLKCHSAHALSMPINAKVQLSEGVSCEVCHGPASQWIGPHRTADWRAKSKSDKSKLGFRNLSSPRERVETCITCHVGTPGFEVTHEMIAAGHPKMRFEMTAFLEAIPQHWYEARTRRLVPQFAAKVWLIGQTATLKQTIANMEARSPDRARFEFADHDCYACHRSLSTRSFGKKLVGADSRTWGRWPAELMLLAEKRSLGLPQGTIEDFSQLRDQHRLTKLDDSALQLHALSEKLAAWDAFADQVEWSPSQLRAMMFECTAPVSAGQSEREVARQRFWALTALSQSRDFGNEAATKKLVAPLRDLKDGLNGVAGGGPSAFDREAFNRHLNVMRQALPTAP